REQTANARRRHPRRGQIVHIGLEVTAEVLDLVEAVVGAAGGQRDGVGVPSGYLVEEVHRRRDRIAHRDVQILAFQLDHYPTLRSPGRAAFAAVAVSSTSRVPTSITGRSHTSETSGSTVA